MKRIERYKTQLDGLKAKKYQLMRAGRYFELSSLNKDISELEALIKETEQMQSKPIAELVSPEELEKSNIIPLILECHLIADLLADACYNVIDRCKELGLCDISLMPDLKDITKKSQAFASFLTTVNPTLCDLVCDNQYLNTSLHKRILKHISQRVAIPKSKEKVFCES